MYIIHEACTTSAAGGHCDNAEVDYDRTVVDMTSLGVDTVVVRDSRRGGRCAAHPPRSPIDKGFTIYRDSQTPLGFAVSPLNEGGTAGRGRCDLPTPTAPSRHGISLKKQYGIYCRERIFNNGNGAGPAETEPKAAP